MIAFVSGPGEGKYLGVSKDKAVFCRAGASFAEEVAHCAWDLVKREDRDHEPGLV